MNEEPRIGIDLEAIRDAMERFDPSPRIEPNARIELDEVFFPEGHRSILDMRRQLVVGNRGMGKSFWTHVLANVELRDRLAEIYRLPSLSSLEVVIGFNGSEKQSDIAPTKDEISHAVELGYDPDLIWRAVLIRATLPTLGDMGTQSDLNALMGELRNSPNLYSQTLTRTDSILTKSRKSLLIVFDALDLLSLDWSDIRRLTRALLIRAVGLQSFQSIRLKIFMRADQFADGELFQFPDASKIRNDHVSLIWRSYELYGLLLFSIMRYPNGMRNLQTLADRSGLTAALPREGRVNRLAISEQARLINEIAGEFMGTHKKRGRVYTWVPLHLSDAANTCSPRTFLTAWKTAAEHIPPPTRRVVDHLGLIEGVRTASATRMTDLREDYPWIDHALGALQGKFVPIIKDDLFEIWREAKVTETILSQAAFNNGKAPIGLTEIGNVQALLDVMKSIAVMEERANGKINVPDIFRVEAKILRRGGVAVPNAGK